MVSAKRSRQRKQSGREDVQPARNLVEFTVDCPGSHESSFDLNRNLRYRRNHRGLTGVTLADLAGVSAGMATRIEKGDVAPSIQTRVSTADALEVPTSMFSHCLNRRPSVSFELSGKGLVSDRGGTRPRA